MQIVRKPVLCNYYITYRCNARCGFCDIWQQPSPYIDVARARRNLEDLRSLGVKVIDFTGGEPLLHRQLPKLLTIAKELGFITTVTTNALLYPKRATQLAGLVDMLHFSLDAWEADLHNEMRGVNCYDSVLRSIEIALELGERPDILFTVFDRNFNQIKPVYERISYPNNLVLILNPAFDYSEVETGKPLTASQLDELQGWGKKQLVYLNKAFVQLIKDGGNRPERPVCRAGSATVVISPHNELIAPCYHLSVQKLPLRDNLLQVYHSAAAQRARAAAGRLEACRGCTINCYMQPSFAVNVNKYFWQALPSTLKYNRMKGTWKQLFGQTAKGSRPGATIDK